MAPLSVLCLPETLHRTSVTGRLSGRTSGSGVLPLAGVSHAVAPLLPSLRLDSPVWARGVAVGLESRWTGESGRAGLRASPVSSASFVSTFLRSCPFPCASGDSADVFGVVLAIFSGGEGSTCLPPQRRAAVRPGSIPAEIPAIDRFAPVTAAGSATGG
jgi:hypothetical protein